MILTYKYRIYPTKEQELSLTKFFGCVRFVYNLALETKIRCWKEAKISIGRYCLSAQLRELKNTEAVFLKECPSQTLQIALKNLDVAYKMFFKGNGFPRYKNKYSQQVLHFPQKVYIKNDCIMVPKLGGVKITLHRPLGIGKIKTVSITKTPTGKYFASILIDNQIELVEKKPVCEKTTIGIDLGIKKLATLSNGDVYGNLKLFRSMKDKLRRSQRSLARKKKGSNRREKQKRVVAKLHEKVRNQRNDYLHKTTTGIVRRFNTICIEDLNIQGMVKNKNLSLAIAEIGWGIFIRMLIYKSELGGINLIKIGRYDPSSKMCSICGHINTELTLSVRNWVCSCGASHDRDVNAAVNVKNIGLRNRPSFDNVSH